MPTPDEISTPLTSPLHHDSSADEENLPAFDGQASPIDPFRLLDLTPEALIIYDSNFRIVYVNATARREMASPGEEVLGKVLWELYPEISSAYHQPLTRAMQERITLTFEIQSPPNGAWTEGHCFPVDTPEGPALAIFFRNVTAQKRASARAEILQRISASLVRALTQTQVAEVMIHDAMPSLNAAIGMVAMLSEDGQEFHTLGQSGYPLEVARAWNIFPVDAMVPIADAVKSGEPIFLQSVAERSARYPHLENIRQAAGNGALAALPLVVDGRSVGGMVIVFGNNQRLDTEEQAFLMTLASLCGQALGRARLQEQTQREVNERLRAEEALKVGEERLLLALEGGELGTWHWDLVKGEVEWATRTKDLFRIPQEMILNREQTLNFVHPDDRSRINAAMQSAIAGGPDYDVEYRIVWPDGTIHWLASRGKVYRNADGAAISIEGVVQNIDGRKQAEETLKESETRFRALADNIAQLAWMCDGSGWIFWYNQRWFDYTGTTLDEMQGWGWGKVHHPDHLAGVVEKFSRHLQTGEQWEDTFPLRGKDGSYRWFLSRAFPIRDAAGTVILWCGTNTDITEQREAEEELTRAFRRETLINQIGQAIRQSHDPEHIQSAACQALGEALKVDRAYFTLIDLARDESRNSDGFRREDLPSLAGTYKISDFQIDPAAFYREGKTLVLPDVNLWEWSEPLREALRSLRFRAAISVPLFDNGALAGTLAVAMADEPREWTDDEVSLVESVAVQTRAALDTAAVQEREHRIAQHLQDALQPGVPEHVPGLSVGKFTKAALEEAEVGGDFYDIFPLDKKLYAIVIGDVSGKGLAAAQQLALIRNSLRTTLYLYRTPAQAVNSLNVIVSVHTLLVGFVTAFVAVYDAGTGNIAYASCGHEPGLIRRASGAVEVLETTGPPLGVAENAEFTEKSFTLAPDDMLLLYTDGLSESGPNRREMLGTDGLVRILQHLPIDLDTQAFAETILKEATAYSHGVFRDDVAILLARRE